jgi:hypothetical protein
LCIYLKAVLSSSPPFADQLAEVKDRVRLLTSSCFLQGIQLRTSITLYQGNMAAPGGAAARAAVGAVGGGPGRPAGAAEQNNGGGGAASVIKNVLRVFLLTQAVQLGIKYFTAPKDGAVVAPAGKAASSTSIHGDTTTTAPVQAQAQAQPGIVPLWPQGTEFDVHFFVSGADGRLDLVNPELPHYTVSGLKLGDWKWEHDWHTEVVLPKVRRLL